MTAEQVDGPGVEADHTVTAADLGFAAGDQVVALLDELVVDQQAAAVEVDLLPAQPDGLAPR